MTNSRDDEILNTAVSLWARLERGHVGFEEHVRIETRARPLVYQGKHRSKTEVVMRRLERGLKFVVMVCVVSMATVAHGAAIIWGGPQDISGDGDVSTWQFAERAYNFHRTNIDNNPAIVIAPVVSGVTFESFAIQSIKPYLTGYGTGTATTITVGDTTLSVDVDGIGALNKDIYGTTSAPFKNLTVAYQDLVGSSAEEDYRTGAMGVFTLQLAGLTNGVSYELQIWSNDSRADLGDTRRTTFTAGNAIQLDQNVSGAVGGLGQYAIGTFTADGTTQSLTIDGKVAAFQLRTAVPEPASLTLFAVAGLFALCRRRIARDQD